MLFRTRYVSSLKFSLRLGRVRVCEGKKLLNSDESAIGKLIFISLALYERYRRIKSVAIYGVLRPKIPTSNPPTLKQQSRD